MPHSPGTGAIYGVVAEDSVPKASSPVKLYDRSTGGLLRGTLTAGDGSFAFTGLNPETDDYQILCTDEDGGPAFKNAEVVDRITPTSMAIGANWREGWYRLMAQAGFQYFWPAPAWDNRNSRVPSLNSGSVPTYAAASGTCQFNQTSLLPNVPELPSVQVGNGAATGFLWAARGSQYVIPANTNPGNSCSHAFVVDFDAANGWLLGTLGARTDSGSISDSSPVLRISFNKSNNTLAVFGNAGNQTGAGGDPAQANNEVTTGTQIATATITSPPSGAALVTVVFVSATSLQVYINKDLVINASSSIPTLQKIADYQHAGFILTGYSATEPYPSSTGQKIGLYARAIRAVTQTDVDNIYDALFTANVAVTETGIRRAILSLYPECYYELDTTAGGVSYDRFRAAGTLSFGELNVRPSMTLVGTGATDVASPVVGGAAVSLAGTAAWIAADQHTAGTIATQTSFVFHLRMNATDTGVITKVVTAAALTTTAGFSIEVVSGNKISLIITSDTTVAFQTVLANSTDYIVGIVLDKTTATATAKLYLNGVLTETINTTTTIPASTIGFKLLRIGADYNGSVVSNGLNAAISQFAKFNYALTAAHMTDIYSSITVP